MITDKGVGLERIQREAFLVLFNSLNDELQILESAWATLDEQLATATGKTNIPITLERIEDINFYLGHRPSLIEAPISRYPNVSVMAYHGAPEPPNQNDHFSIYRARLFVEIMVKSERYEVNENDTEPLFEAERIVNARIQRTTDAVNNVLQSNKTLNGITTDTTLTRDVFISDVFVRDEHTSYGNPWLWQGSRLEYEVSKVARLDESPQGIYREGIEIDQLP